MKARDGSDSSAQLYSDKEQEFNQFNDFFLAHKTSVLMEIAPKDSRIVLVEADKDNLAKSTLTDSHDLSPMKQTSNSTSQIHNAMHNSSEALPFPDMQDGFSYEGKETVDRSMQHIENDIPPGYKKMIMWDQELQRVCIGTVPEDTPKLTDEELNRYSAINPQ